MKKESGKIRVIEILATIRGKPFIKNSLEGENTKILS